MANPDPQQLEEALEALDAALFDPDAVTVPEASHVAVGYMRIELRPFTRWERFLVNGWGRHIRPRRLRSWLTRRALHGDHR